MNTEASKVASRIGMTDLTKPTLAVFSIADGKVALKGLGSLSHLDHSFYFFFKFFFIAVNSRWSNL